MLIEENGYTPIYASFDHKPIKVKDFVKEDQTWLAARREGLGGSDASVLMGDSPYQIIRDLYMEKIGVKSNAQEDPYQWFLFEYGHIVEPLVIKLFQAKTNAKIIKTSWLYRHPKYPFMQANCDALYQLADGSIGIFEAKTASHRKEWKWQRGLIPKEYVWQVRHYMAVLNINKAYIGCLCGNSVADFFYQPIERDAKLEDELIAAEMNFWENYVVPRIEPPLEGPASLRLKHAAAYSKMPKSSNGKFITFSTTEAADAYKEYRNLDDLCARLKTSLDAAKQKRDAALVPIRLAMDDSERAHIILPSSRVGIIERNETTPRETVKMEELKKLYPDIYTLLNDNKLLKKGCPGEKIKVYAG